MTIRPFILLLVLLSQTFSGMALVSFLEGEAGGCCGVTDGVHHSSRSECGGSGEGGGGMNVGFGSEMRRGGCGCLCQEDGRSQGGPQEGVPAVGAYRFEIDAELLWREWKGGAELWRLRDERRALVDACFFGRNQRRPREGIPIHGDALRERICSLQI